MREYQEKNKYKKYLYSKISIAILLLLIVVLAHATWQVYGKVQTSAAGVAAVDSQLARLQDRNDSLVDQLNRLNTDEGVEAEIRSQYNVAKPGEKLIVITNNDDATGTATSTPEPSFWQKFIGFFK